MLAILITLAIILLFIGLMGTVLPALPGLPFIFIGAWILAYISHYQIIGPITLIILALITFTGCTLDFLAGLLGAKYCGASKQALWGALIGSVVGLFFHLPGLIFGPLVGAAIGEWLARRDLMAAGKVGMATLIGFIIGVIAKVGCAMVMLLIILTVYIYSAFQQ